MAVHASTGTHVMLTQITMCATMCAVWWRPTCGAVCCLVQTGLLLLLLLQVLHQTAARLRLRGAHGRVVMPATAAAAGAMTTLMRMMHHTARARHAMQGRTHAAMTTACLQARTTAAVAATASTCRPDAVPVTVYGPGAVACTTAAHIALHTIVVNGVCIQHVDVTAAAGGRGARLALTV